LLLENSGMHVFIVHWCKVRFYWNTGGVVLFFLFFYFCINKPIASWFCRCTLFRES